MVERFGYSLDVGKSLESEEKNKEDNVEEEPLKTPTGEDLSADSVEKDILDDIKEDIEVNPSNAEEVDSADELHEKEDDDDEPTIANTSDEVYKKEVSAEKIAPIVNDESAQDEEVIDQKEELDEFEEPMPDEPEDEPEPEPEKIPGPEEEDVNEMVDKSFKEDAKETDTIIETDTKKTRSMWKWGAGVVIILVLAFVVIKFGFIGVVNNNPTSAVPVDDIDKELEEFFKDSYFEEEPIPETEKTPTTKKVLFEDGTTQTIEEPTPVEEPEPIVEPEPEPVPEPKDPDELLDILKQGLN